MADKQDKSNEEHGQLRQADVMRRFSVSLVFQREVGDTLLSTLRVTHVDARSEEEALGQGLQHVWAEKELTDYSLGLRVVMEFSAA